MKPSKTVQPWEPSTPNHINITITSLLQSHQHQKKLNINFWVSPPQKKVNIKFQGYHDWPSAASPLPPRLGATLARCCLSIPQIDRLKARSQSGWRSPGSQREWVSRGRGDHPKTEPWGKLGCGFNIFLFSPRKLGEDEPNLTVRIFFRWGGKKPPTSKLFWVCFGGFKFSKPSG